MWGKRSVDLLRINITICARDWHYFSSECHLYLLFLLRMWSKTEFFTQLVVELVFAKLGQSLMDQFIGSKEFHRDGCQQLFLFHSVYSLGFFLFPIYSIWKIVQSTEHYLLLKYFI